MFEKIVLSNIRRLLAIWFVGGGWLFQKNPQIINYWPNWS